MAFQGDTPNPNSSKGKSLEKIVSKNPFLRKMRAQSRGEKAADITTGVNDQAYKDGYSKIKWTKPEFKEKPKFKTRINGVVVSDPDNDENS
jgi:hypothetical protein